MIKPALPVAAVVLLALSACNSTTPEPAPGETPGESGSTVADPTETAPVTDPATPQPTDTAPPPTALVAFPAAMQGRWGLVPADCTSRPGETRSLLTIGPREIRFYESIAELKSVTVSGPTRLRATLAYEGEGMQWSRDAAIELKSGGDQLVLEEFGRDVVPGPRTYSRCK